MPNAHSIVTESPAGDAAHLHAALEASAGDVDALEAHAALEALLARVRPTPDRPDFEAASTICPPPASSPFAGPVALIVETRRHLNLPFVVRQVARRCDVPVQIMHGVSNEAFVRERLADLIAERRVLLTRLGANRLSGKIYNGLFLSERFWEAMQGRGKIFTFQTDSMLCQNSEKNLENFIEFDYIGSRRPPGQGCGLVFGGGNGGVSLRDWGRSVRALRRFEPRRWQAGEDDFFPLFLEADGARVATADDSDRFCGQRWFQPGCFALHKPNFRKARLAASILFYEPGAWRLLGPIERRLARS